MKNFFKLELASLLGGCLAKFAESEEDGRRQFEVQANT